MKACVFPGQGAQEPGMGAGLFERYPEITAAADEILGYSVAELCLRQPEKLHQTQYTQPALYVVNALTYLSQRDDGMPPPDFVAGHSLGEYNALLAAEVFDFAVGLRLVKKRGELMSAASGGGMAAVLGCDWAQVEEILRQHGLHTIDVANYNSPTQVVLSGPAEDIARADLIFSDTGATYRILNVSAAFHSRYMESCVESLREVLDGAELHPPKIPVLSNVTARPHGAGELKAHLQRQIREPVRWLESVRYLLDAGVEEFEEVGPGSVLTKLIRSIRKEEPRRRARPKGEHAVTAGRLGSASFRRDYNVRRAYVAGAMSHGIASRELVIRMGKAGYLGVFGAAGLEIDTVEEDIRSIRESLRQGEPFGVGLQSNPDDPGSEMALVDLCLRHGVRYLEASGYVAPSAALIRYRLEGLSRDGEGKPVILRRVIAKVSRPDVAEMLLSPPPEHLVEELSRAGRVSREAAELARRIPMADDLCVEAGCGDAEAAAVLLPRILRQRDEICRRHGYGQEVRVGCAGGIGTPEAAAAAFLLGADFVLTGSINQCTVEAATSEEVKELLQTIDVHDTDAAPAGDLFELGARSRFLKKGVLFPARANKLYDLWRHHGSWEEIDASTRTKIERDFLGRRFESAYAEIRQQATGEELRKAERDPRHRMALVFRWYFQHAMRLALAGTKEQRGNYQVRCGPALGAFNQWVKGTRLESWRCRHVDVIADEIMEGAAEFLGRQLERLAARDGAPRS